MNTIQCDWNGCGNTFIQKKTEHRFCSDRCRKKWHRRKKGQPIVPSFISKRKKSVRPSPRIKSVSTLSPRIAELQTKINWLEGQKVHPTATNSILYGLGSAIGSRFLVKDWRANLVFGVAGFFYGKERDRINATSIQLQNVNIQRQIDELITDISRENEGVNNVPSTPQTVHADFKMIMASRVGELEHKKYDLTDKWRYFLNYLPTSFNGIVYGLPKAGKTHFAIQLAQYLQTKFGGVLYVSGEEGVEEPFNDKLKRYMASFTVAYDVKGSFGIMKAIEKNRPKFVFIDSLNRLNLNVNDIIRFKEQFPNTVFVYVMQSNKDGSFKGSQSIEHEVTSTIRVIDGVAHQRGRTVAEPTELAIFG